MQAELPKLVDLADSPEFADVESVAVLIANDPAAPNFPPADWLDEEQWPGLRAYDDAANTLATAYGVTSFPFIVILNSDGTVAERLSGEQPDGVIAAAVAAAS